VDVHKAIRRLQPVSYYRVPKAPANEDDSIDTGPGPIAKHPTIPREADRERNGDERKLSTVSDHTGKAPPARIRRRRSDGGTEPLHLFKTSPDIRAHLAHLGPSNLASRPNATRINTVKIKPVHPSATKAQHRHEAGSPRSPLVTADSKNSVLLDGLILGPRGAQTDAIETTGLFGPGKSSSDGVQAPGYGTLSTSPTSKIKTPPIPEQSYDVRSSSIVSPVSQPSRLRYSAHILDEPIDPLQKIPEVPFAVEESPTNSATVVGSVDKGKQPSTLQEPSPPHREHRPSVAPVKLIITPEDTAGAISDEEGNDPEENDSGSTIKSAATGTSEAKRNAARSGSILQRDIDVNGVKKVVLDVQVLPEGASEDEGDGQSEPSQPLLSPTSGGEPSTSAAGAQVVKKKKKKKPKKKKKASE
jgi:metal transporter CNNM